MITGHYRRSRSGACRRKEPFPGGHRSGQYWRNKINDGSASSMVMVGQDLAPTAAHCVMDVWSNAPFPLHHIHLLAGVRAAQNNWRSVAKRRYFRKAYEIIGPKKIRPRMAARKCASASLRMTCSRWFQIGGLHLISCTCHKVSCANPDCGSSPRLTLSIGVLCS